MIAQHSEVVTLWRGIVGTLAQRGLLKQRQDGAKVIPQAVGVVEPERVSFVLDMQRLAGIPREQWLDHDLWAQARATLQGRRVFVADSAGLALVVAREPGTRTKRLPTSIVMRPDRTPPGDYTALLGTAAGGDVVLDLAKDARALLVGGTTGSGKTRSIISLILQLAHKNGPDRLALALVDLKRLDFTALNALPHLVRPTATTEAEAGDLVEWCVQEMKRRQAMMRAASVTRWDRLHIEERFPLLLVAVDECADFADSAVMGSLVELARKGRASGVSLVLATQRPDAQVINRQVKANLTTRLAFRVTDVYESRIILDRAGAEKIKRRGLALTNAGGKWRKVQCGYIPDEETREWCNVAPSGPALSAVERDLVCYAVEKLCGAFKIDPLYQAHKGTISRRRLLKLARGWEQRGWLSKPASVTDPRRVTDELAELAGCTPGASNDTTVRQLRRSTTVVRRDPERYDVELPPFLRERRKETGV